MANKISEDPRIDKRIKDVFGLIEIDAVMTEHDTREEMMAFEETEEAGGPGAQPCSSSGQLRNSSRQ